mmetsp:Transcript_88348/g.248865  ORF Transcript_88348/g.248865 Transcript_88348/m.248865 type:complete len:321 (-) Transcript_88348:12-974(-)
MREERHMAQELVANVGLGRVEGIRAVPNVLGRPEDAKRQSVEEVTRGKQTRHRPDLETCVRMEHFAHLIELWNAVFGKGAMLAELVHGVFELLARVLFLQRLEPRVNYAPSFVLVRSVIHDRYGSTRSVLLRVPNDLVPPRLVRLVVEAWVVLADEGRAAVQSGAGVVQLLERARKPRDFPRLHVVDSADAVQSSEVRHAALHRDVVRATLKVKLEDGSAETVLVQFGLDVREVQPVLPKALEDDHHSAGPVRRDVGHRDPERRKRSEGWQAHGRLMQWRLLAHGVCPDATPRATQQARPKRDSHRCARKAPNRCNRMFP